MAYAFSVLFFSYAFAVLLAYRTIRCLKELTAEVEGKAKMVQVQVSRVLFVQVSAYWEFETFSEPPAFAGLRRTSTLLRGYADGGYRTGPGQCAFGVEHRADPFPQLNAHPVDYRSLPASVKSLAPAYFRRWVHSAMINWTRIAFYVCIILILICMVLEKTETGVCSPTFKIY